MRTSRIPLLAFAAALLLLEVPAFAAVDAFIWFENVAGAPVGESKDPNHPGWIEIESYQLGQFQEAASIGSATSGAGGGKVRFNEFTIKKTVDKASPAIMKACLAGRHFPEVTLHVRKAGAGQHDYLVYKLKEVMLSSYQTGGSGPSKTETFQMNFASAKLEYEPTSPKTALQVAPAAGAVALVNARTITKVTPSASSANVGQTLTFLVEGTGDCNRSRIDFGDGTVVEFPFQAGKSQPSPSHVYLKGGTFEVKAYGLADPWAKLPAPPQAAEHPCSGHASANVSLQATTRAVAPAVR